MKKNYPLIMFLSILGLWSCQKSIDKTSDPGAGNLSKSSVNIYVAGEEANAPGLGVTGSFAKYWKNGKAVNLTNGSSYAYATSIFVSGSDIYVSSYEYLRYGYFRADYWKNGSNVNLTYGLIQAQTKSIFVSGSDVYVAGWQDGTGAAYWKNGSRVTLSSAGGTTSSVVVSGTDVYVAGYAANGCATYWKNGNPITLSSKTSYATSIVVSGTDVYVAGYVDNGTTHIATY